MQGKPRAPVGRWPRDLKVAPNSVPATDLQTQTQLATPARVGQVSRRPDAPGTRLTAQGRVHARLRLAAKLRGSFLAMLGVSLQRGAFPLREGCGCHANQAMKTRFVGLIRGPVDGVGCATGWP